MYHNSQRAQRSRINPAIPNDYLARARRALLGHSQEKRSFKKAALEWNYTGFSQDLPDCCGICGLCGHQGLRHQFEIRNRHTRRTLLLGSECIQRWIRDSSLSEKAKKQIGASIRADKRAMVLESSRRHVDEAISKIIEQDNEFDFEQMRLRWRTRGAFSPNELVVLFWRLQEQGIDFAPSAFTVPIKRKKERSQLKTMAQWKLMRIWLALSSSQCRWCRNHRVDGAELPPSNRPRG